MICPASYIAETREKNRYWAKRVGLVMRYLKTPVFTCTCDVHVMTFTCDVYVMTLTHDVHVIPCTWWRSCDDVLVITWACWRDVATLYGNLYLNQPISPCSCISFCSCSSLIVDMPIRNIRIDGIRKQTNINIFLSSSFPPFRKYVFNCCGWLVFWSVVQLVGQLVEWKGICFFLNLTAISFPLPLPKKVTSYATWPGLFRSTFGLLERQSV